MKVTLFCTKVPFFAQTLFCTTFDILKVQVSLPGRVKESLILLSPNFVEKQRLKLLFRSHFRSPFLEPLIHDRNFLVELNV